MYGAKCDNSMKKNVFFPSTIVIVSVEVEEGNKHKCATEKCETHIN